MGRHSGNSGMGLSKHRKSGTTGYSPKVKHGMKRRAERDEKKPAKPKCKYKTVADARRDK